jgi:hypothetical protein
LAGKGTKEINGYANGRVNALPLPYPAHCHPYVRRGVDRKRERAKGIKTIVLEINVAVNLLEN